MWNGGVEEEENGGRRASGGVECFLGPRGENFDVKLNVVVGKKAYDWLVFLVAHKWATRLILEHWMVP